jgi:DNA mismatch repair protein MutL
LKRINILNEDTANKIAAGEVVERPSSVVKELVENSIDANSKNITIEIEEGGTALIRIIDDGDGIYKDDIAKAFLPHATSKIKTSEDIYSIHTLGFRGEALPSIASVSKINLKTKQENAEFGFEISIEGGTASEITECGTNKGTQIEVCDLFYNVPARKKFLKSISKEGALISDIITRLALANPKISFKLYNNHKKILHTFGNGNLKDVIRTIYGKAITESILYFEDTSDLITVYGYVGKEEIARGSRNNQSIFVNKRYIKNKSLTVAVEQAFKSFSTVSKFPFFILFIEIYPEYVDVNIHPTKAEIKFNDERMIFSKIFGAVHNALKNEVFDSFAIEGEEEKKQDTLPSFEEISFKIKEEEEHVKIANSAAKAIMEQGKNLKINNKSVYDNKDINEINLNYNRNLNNNDDIIGDNNKPEDSYRTIVDIPVDLKANRINEEFLDNYTKDKEEEVTINNENKSNINLNPEIESENKEIQPVPKFPPITIIGQYNSTYILGEYEGTLYMIDQHAAHEKILFEKYLKEIEEGTLIIQPLIIPNIIDLSIDDYSYYDENKEVFKEAGFLLEEFGGNSLSLKEVPYFLGKLNPKNLFLDILDNLKNLGNGKTTEVKHNAIASKACKAAIKGNDKLELREMIKLVEDLRYIDDPFHCPHGRPVIIQFTSVDIDKKFRRII